MSAPLLWSVFPFAFGALLLLFSEKRKLTIVLALLVCGLLAAIAVTIPINSLILVGDTSIIFTDSIEVLGRTLSLSRSTQPLLAFFFVYAALWILSSLVIQVHRFFVPLVLMETALLIGMTAVSPFIYGAFLILFAALIAIPIFWVQKTVVSSEGTIRFLLFQVLGLIFLALGGWMAAAVDINPSDEFLLRRTVIVLLVGFVFWLAIFPFHNWVALLMDETCPSLSGFTITILQFSTFFILLNFLRKYLWLRTYQPLFVGMQIIGILMLIIGSLWGFFQRSVQRIHAFQLVAENGILLFLLGVKTEQSFSIFFSLLFIRVFTSIIWAFAVKCLGQLPDFNITRFQGLYHRKPFVSAALIVSYFALAGFPLLPSFPFKTAMISIAFAQSSDFGWAAAFGLFVLLAAGFSLGKTLFGGQESDTDLSGESLGQKLFLSAAILLILLIAIFPGYFNQIVALISSEFQTILNG